MDSNQIQEPVTHQDFFTRKAIATHIAFVSSPTFNSYIKNDKIFEPSHISERSISSNPRKYYTLADAMRISIILHDAIQMSAIKALLEDHKNINDQDKLKMIKESFRIVKQQIADKSTSPIDLSPYLQEV